VNPCWPQKNLSVWLNNAHAEIHWHETLGLAYTQTFASDAQDACYITSLRSAWFNYTAQELKSSHRWSSLAIELAGRVGKFAGLDQLLIAGNRPISTNLWESDEFYQLIELCEYLMQAHPNNYIGVRNLLPHLHEEWIKKLQQSNFYAFPSRVIYEFDCRSDWARKSSHLKRDLSLLSKSNLNVVIKNKINNDEAIQIRDFYNAIYIQKHSPLNAQYTKQFFLDVINENTMQCLCIYDNNLKLLAFALLYQVGFHLSVPALGYNTTSQIEGIYRTLFAALFRHTEEQRLILNFSSGAGDFKRKRGGIPRLEYTMLRPPEKANNCIKVSLAWMAKKSKGIQANDLILYGA
jgi:hypothetical protein